MSNIDIRHAHSLDPTSARHAVQDIADKLSQRFGVACVWDGNVLNFERSGIEGFIDVRPQMLHVNAKLGFLYSAMKGPIEHEIRRVLGERFG